MLCLFKTISLGDGYTWGVSFDIFLGYFSNKDSMETYIINNKDILEDSDCFYLELEDGFILTYDNNFEIPNSIKKKYF